MKELAFRLLKVDLASEEVSRAELPSEILRKHVGGASLAAHVLYPYLWQELDPLSEEAPLLFMNGPLTGTRGPSVGRYVICAKSPATGLWGESNCGGNFGPELRSSGVDGLLIVGKSDSPTYLWIDDGVVEFRSADHLWGKTDTYETQRNIVEELQQPSAKVASIGLAGERGIPFALVLCDHGRVAGRTGMGAVMGSKRLKAIAVRGTQDIPLARPEVFGALRRKINIQLKDDNVSRVLRDYGTSGSAEYSEYMGEMPAKGFARGSFGDVEKISGYAFANSLLHGVSTCHGCVIACGRVVKLGDGKKRKGPEYETIVGFGPILGTSDKSFITRMGELCDRYGMDVISLSNTMSLAFHLYQEGFIDSGDLEGLELVWGDQKAIETLVHKTARGEGLGEWIAKGSLGLGRHYQVPEKAVQVNGLEVAYHDPRGSSGMALVYATSPRGACHNQSDYFMLDVWGQVEEELGYEYFGQRGGAEKAGNVARHQNWTTLLNALVMCIFANVPAQDLAELLNYATGFDYTVDDLFHLGERGWNLKRAINHRLGLTGANDRLPLPLLEPMPDGASQGYVIPFEEMLQAYYKVRDWDPESGRPSPEKLRSLALSDIISDVWKS
jgi:aldehyde:ferredoxin oxidoreductase